MSIREQSDPWLPRLRFWWRYALAVHVGLGGVVGTLLVLHLYQVIAFIAVGLWCSGFCALMAIRRW